MAALDHPNTKRTTFEIVWGPGTRRATWSALLEGLIPDRVDA